MKYERIEIGRFIERPNRFIAYVEIAGKKETVHVKNTGRCAELLTPNASVYVQRAENPDKKNPVGSDRCKKRETYDQYGFPDTEQSSGGMD